MPVFKNIANTLLLLERENGLKPDIELLPGDTFSGSEDYYNKFVSEGYLERQTDGWAVSTTVRTTPTNDFIASLDGFIKEDGITATAADALVNSEVTAGNTYSAFGKVSWTESGTDYEAYFSVTGNGTHGSGSDFSVSASDPVGATANPVEAASVIDVYSGTITFRLAGAGAYNASVEVIYNPSLEGYRIVHFRNELLQGPFITTVQTVNGENQITSKKIFYTGSKIGDIAKLYTMTYTGTQTEPDSIVEELSTVTQTDLDAI
ncbi:MAG: hypothetical protein ACOCUD_03470 [Bacillota bacterium]